MITAISDFVAEQESLNSQMDVAELNGTIARATMGYVFLKECLEETNDLVMEKSGLSSEFFCLLVLPLVTCAFFTDSLCAPFP